MPAKQNLEKARKIIKLHKKGITQRKICELVQCSRWLVAAVITNGFRKRQNKNQTFKNQYVYHPFHSKRRKFLSGKTYIRQYRKAKTKVQSRLNSKVKNFSSSHYNKCKPMFSLKDVINKFGTETKCYLTGDNIDIYQPSTYAFDHKIPKSRGGDNSINNLGICTTQANKCKVDLTPEELIEFCKKVLINNNYTVNHNNTSI